MKRNELAMWCRASLVAILASAPSYAEQVGEAITHDLNGDGVDETFWLDHRGDGMADLIITHPRGWSVEANDIAWIGGIGQQPELGLTKAGSITVTSMNEAIGRNRWSLTLTIAFRDGDYQVVGFTFSHRDTLDLDAGGTCDFNLLTGRGIVELAGHPAKSVAAPFGAAPVTQWSADIDIPPACLDDADLR